MSNEQDRDEIERAMRVWFDRSLNYRIDRRLRVPVHPMIPYQYFTNATVQCRDMFTDGYYYGCITLVQSIAEGLAKFLAEKNNIPLRDHHMSLVNALQKDRSNPVISSAAYAAFRKIRGEPEDRNTFHHFDACIEQSKHSLEARAEECLKSLNEVEAEVFAYGVEQGRIVPKHPNYWPEVDQGTTFVYVRQK